LLPSSRLAATGWGYTQALITEGGPGGRAGVRNPYVHRCDAPSAAADDVMSPIVHSTLAHPRDEEAALGGKELNAGVGCTWAGDVRHAMPV